MKETKKVIKNNSYCEMRRHRKNEWSSIPLNKVRRFALWREAEAREFEYCWRCTAGAIINVLLNTDEIGTDEAEFLYEFIRQKSKKSSSEAGKLI